jgi:hypothetical protein
MSKILGKVFLLAFVSLFIFSSGAFAKPVSMQMAEDVARTHLSANNERERLAALTARKAFDKRSISTPDIIELKDEQTGEILAYVLGLTPEGFIVVSPDTDITPVIAYSFKGSFPLEDFQDNVLLHMVTRDMENRLEAIPIVSDEFKEKNNDLWEKHLSAESSFLDAQASATKYGSYLKTTWDQGSPYNVYCPYDPFEGEKSAVGCVATAMAQIVNYHQYPSSVTFTSADNYCYDYPGTSFERCNNNAASVSIPSITYPASTDTAAKLSRACGVSVKMAYSASSKGSGAFHTDAASAFENKFGYTSATLVSNVPPTTLFFATLRSNLRNSQPALLAIRKTGSGHSIVCDGYIHASPTYYHLNYGGGSNNPTPPWWYTLPSGMPGGYNVISDGVLDIKPPASGTLGGDNYCRDYGPCSEGQGDCDPGQCQSGLTCVNDVGPKYGWKKVTDVCEKSSTSGTLGGDNYCRDYGPCSEGQGDCDPGQCQSGLTCVNNVGPKYGWKSETDVCEKSSTSGTLGGDNYCRDYGPCSAGQGDCDSNAECQSGLTCVNDVGQKYGWKSVTDVCEKSAEGGNLTVYVWNSTGTRLLSGATVTVGGKSATTGSGGYVTITNIAAGTRTVTVSYGGYYNYYSVDIVAGTTVSYYVLLSWVN